MMFIDIFVQPTLVIINIDSELENNYDRIVTYILMQISG